MTPALGIKFGEGPMREGVSEWNATHLTDPYRRATFKMEAEDLGVVDFLAPVAVSEVTSGNLVFTGVLTEASINGSTWSFTLRTGSQELSEIQMDGLIVGPGTPVPEQIRSILAVVGIPDDRMSIQGLALPPPNPFEITVPIEGVEMPTDPIPVGDVTLLGTLEPSMMVNDLSADPQRAEFLDRFRGASCWAHVIVQSSSLDEAEALGLSKIDLALSQLLLASRYSFSATTAGDPLPYSRRAAQLARNARGAIVHVRALTSPHRWLRGLNLRTESSELDATQLPPISQLRSDDDPKLGVAANSLRRSILAPDPYGKISLLWQCVELYVSSDGRTPPPKLFTSNEMTEAIERAVEGLSPEQTERLQGLRQFANNAPLAIRFESALEGDSVPFEGYELEALKRTRAIRNDLEHGRVLSPVQAADVSISISFMTRVLAFAMK